MFLKFDSGNRLVIGNADVEKTLVDGVYSFHQLHSGEEYFNPMTMNSDNIIDIPTPSYLETLNEFREFIKPETRKLYEDMGFLYKKSLVLQGPAGTGKTILVQRITKEFLTAGSIVIYNPKVKDIPSIYAALKDQKESRLVIIMEEFDAIVKENEKALLTILDGEEQRPNTIFLMTTNFIERIPKRILRPSRVSNIVYVGFPEKDARKAYLTTKNVPEAFAEEIASKTDGFTIDELKEVVVGTMILKIPLDEALVRVKEYKSTLNSGEATSKNPASDFKGALVNLLYGDDEQ